MNLTFKRLNLLPVVMVLAACMGGDGHHAQEGPHGSVSQAAPGPGPGGCPTLPLTPTQGVSDPFERFQDAGALAGEGGVSDTGAFTYTIPIWVPEGRDGLQPSFALDYNSQRGKGIVARGWTMTGTSQIHRCGYNFERDGKVKEVTFGDDNFCLNGEKLVPVDPGELPTEVQLPGGTVLQEYRTERESFARIVSFTRHSHSRAFPEEWIVFHRNGLVDYFGYERGSDVKGLRHGTNIIIPSTIAWLRHRTADRHGNLIDYTYVQRNTDSAARVLDKAEWGHRISGAYAGTPKRRIEFEYGNILYTVQGTYWVGGLNVFNSAELRGIKVYAPNTQNASTSVLARRYILKRDDVNHPELYEFTEDAKLYSVQVCGPYEDTCLPPTTFEYGTGEVKFEKKQGFQLTGQFDGLNWT
ncbi:MAG: SpvB/TcaC N-terminal domain-containing protein, partial [Myxococcota bacterium]